MYFYSPIFVFFFLPTVFLLSRILKNIKAKNAALALMSVVFYSFGQLQYVPLFLLSIVINYTSGRLLMLDKPRRKAVLAASVVLNLGILITYKYTGFLVRNINAWFSLGIPVPVIDLPIGISFYTFQGMSYVIDTYREPKNGSRSFLKVALFLSFFPQLIAGPIVKYHDIAEQIDSRSTNAEDTAYGIRRFIVGMAKKILLADTAGKITALVFDKGIQGALGTMDFRLAWLGAICYTLQIYYDFSGYSDMAIGLGAMFGFRFRENFLHPYGSSSMKEFWRRWHVSLSSWFKEYLYIPLGGNRKGKYRTALNKFIVFFCTGIWHGPEWTFVVWGLCHGLLTSLEDLNFIPVKKLEKTVPGRLVNKAYTLLSVVLLFAVFRANNLSEAGQLFKVMFSGGVSADSTLVLIENLTPAFIFLMALAVLCAGNLVPRIKEKLAGSWVETTVAGTIAVNMLSLVLFILTVMCVSKGGFHPFIYFQF